MKKGLLFLVIGLIATGCASGPSDADQQQLAKDFSPENVAKEYEKQGKFKEAEEIRRNAQNAQNGQ